MERVRARAYILDPSLTELRSSSFWMTAKTMDGNADSFLAGKTIVFIVSDIDARVMSCKTRGVIETYAMPVQSCDRNQG